MDIVFINSSRGIISIRYLQITTAVSSAPYTFLFNLYKNDTSAGVVRVLRHKEKKNLGRNKLTRMIKVTSHFRPDTAAIFAIESSFVK